MTRPDGTVREVVSMPAGMEGFKPEVRFRPVEVYTVADVPEERKCAVFVDGKWVRYNELPSIIPYDEVVIVKKDARGQLISICRTSNDHHNCPIALPKNAQLVPVEAAKA